VRIIAGALRGRRLAAPPGDATRPTADRVRQALFDMLVHAPWAGQDAVAGARVLDAFAGSGALGLEALSRGAAEAVFFETDVRARRALAANIAACRLEARARVIAADATRPSAIFPGGAACSLVLLDPPYAEADIAARAAAALAAAGWIAPGALIVLEMPASPSRERDGARAASSEIAPRLGTPLAERRHGAAKLLFFRAGAGG
jgi:16S rRNA (guanine966-N2)-methyltransferase